MDGVLASILPLLRPDSKSKMSDPEAFRKKQVLFLRGDSEDEDERRPQLPPDDTSPAPADAEPPATSADEAMQVDDELQSKETPVVTDNVEDVNNEPPETEELEAPKEPAKRKPNFFVDSDDEDEKNKPEELPLFPPLPQPSPPPRKKARLDPNEPTPPPIIRAAYLGEFIVDNAFATLSGKGNIKPGDTIHIMRDYPHDPRAPVIKEGSSSNTKNGKTMQQSKLDFTAKSSIKPMKKEKNAIMRFENTKRIEIGRFPPAVSEWMAKLIDLDVIHFQGCTVVDCPPKLRLGSHILLSIKVFIQPSAFKNHITIDDDAPRAAFQEDKETDSEKSLRARKAALLALFKTVGLRPNKSSALGKSAAQLQEDDMEKMVKMTNEPKTPDRLSSAEASDDEGINGLTDAEDDVAVDEENDEEELTDNQLNVIYRKAQQNDQSMLEMEPPPEFALTLRGYQKQALHWMSSMELGTAGREVQSLHPLWEEYIFPPEPGDDGLIDLTFEEEDNYFYFNPYSGELTLDFPRSERTCRGGILADVGMGKTIQMISLILTNRTYPPELEEADQELAAKNKKPLRLGKAFEVLGDRAPRKRTNSTLIIAPTSLLNQWETEIQRACERGTLKTLVWHGSTRLDLEDALEDGEGVDVVITSYGVLGSEWSKQRRSRTNYRSSLFKTEWLRIVLDEAHHTKSRTSISARAVYDLSSKWRWALTGTPIVNRLEDLYSLLKFLDFTPWSSYSFFRSFITIPFTKRDPKAVEIVQVILENVLLRREKTMRDKNGKMIVELPEKEVAVDYLEFSDLERKIYDSIYDEVKSNFDRLNARGLIGKNYTHILAMIMKLRRAVLHPSLVTAKEADDSQDSDDEIVEVKDVKSIALEEMIKKFASGDTKTGSSSTDKFAQAALKELAEQEEKECRICLTVKDENVLIPECFHSCCKDCILSYLAKCRENKEVGNCPMCRRAPLKETDLLDVVRHKSDQSGPSNDDGDDGAEGSSPPDIVLRRNDFQSSTKLNALMQHLSTSLFTYVCVRRILIKCRAFTSFLDLIEIVLKRDRFDYERFDGTMSIKQKKAAVDRFTASSRKPKIFV
ncbi:hypothetical protein SISNIDRAFT_456554, partial [Sistotremastrum niveocremeum HHB9708]